jgi:putative FmdB family regulatory protein
MPHYDYICELCGYKEEILQKITEAPLSTCPQCKQSSFKRQIGRGVGLQFQGSGFYINDYQSQSTSPSSQQENSSSKPDSAGGCGCGKNSCGQ